MFTGIIETTGKIIARKEEGSNIRFTIESQLSSSFKIDQSVSHNGVCFTVVSVMGNHHEVVAVEETLNRSAFKNYDVGTELNIERSLSMSDRIDGHLVQGHVDDVAVCKKIKQVNGSWIFIFQFHRKNAALLVDKGSVSINGVSLTVIKPSKKEFSVAVIPYTFEHTDFNSLKEKDEVNIEFDIIGKYVSRWLTERG